MRELEVFQIIDPKNLWREVLYKIDFQQDVVLPVEFIDEKDLSALGKFHVSLTKDGTKNYLQLEDFDSPEWAEIFFRTFEGNWEIHPGGIYRLEIET